MGPKSNILQRATLSISKWSYGALLFPEVLACCCLEIFPWGPLSCPVWRMLNCLASFATMLQNKQERPLPYQRNTENKGHGFWPQAKAPILNQSLAKSKAFIVPSDVCIWEGKGPVLCSLPVVLCHTGVSLFFCFSHQAHISYHTSQAGLSCILKAWCFIVQNPCS